MPAFSLPAGVPPLLPSGYIDFFSPPPPLSADSISVQFEAAKVAQWGIFLNGVSQVQADNVVSLSYKQDWVVADYQIEGGGFENYDKVQTPFDARVRFSAGASDQDRTNLLTSIANIAAVSKGQQVVYDVVTPEVVYQSTSIVHYDYRREHDRGVGLIAVDIWCQQMRIDAFQTFSNSTTVEPSGADPQSGGLVQPVPPTLNQSAMAGSAT